MVRLSPALRAVESRIQSEMAVTDASVVAHLVTGVLFVVGSEMTK